jgi:soluble lytic murein transglycosylase-like protein
MPPLRLLASLTAVAAALAPASAAAATATGSVAHLVRPGETLWGVAAANGLTAAALAALNGLPADAWLVQGTTIRVPAPTATPPAGAAGARPTVGRVTRADIAAVAVRNGVPASLAAAVAWQESGFNNAFVSPASAVGVMQVTPATWEWVQDVLARRPLDRASAIDNVAAGVLYLGHLLRETAGSWSLAVAAYHQGLASVRARGVLPGTSQYVRSVLALEPRFR